MIDILIPTHNRLKFTQAVVQALFCATEWELVRRVVVMDDRSVDGTAEYVKRITWPWPAETVLITDCVGGPSNAMVRYLQGDPAPIWAKIDSDTMVPPCWLSECLRVMEDHPELGLLGIEAFHPAFGGRQKRTYEPSTQIGGIGLFRTSELTRYPLNPDGRWGFSAWQLHHPEVPRGWLNPALPVFLLDRMPMEPWRSLSEMYIDAGWQRRWPVYDEPTYGHLWSWYQ